MKRKLHITYHSTPLRVLGMTVFIWSYFSFSLLIPATSTTVKEGEQESNKKGISDTETLRLLSTSKHPSNIFKTTHRELEDYAVLQIDKRGNLSSEFTICSTLYTAMHSDHYLLVLLDKSDDIFVRTYAWNPVNGDDYTSETGFGVQNIEYHENGLSRIPKVFPNQWLRSCVAFSMLSGSVSLVIDGILVDNTTSDALKKAADKSPPSLAGKIIIGAVKSSAGWHSISQKVTSINVFSSAMSVEAMITNTAANSKNCDGEGDYLKWEDMEWEIHGDIHVETVTEEPCTKEPRMNLFPTQFVKMSDCMHHCQKLGGRAPKVISYRQWQELQRFMWLNYFSRREGALKLLDGVWLSISDIEKEGEWRDYYTGERIEYDGPFEGGHPDGGEKQKCVVQSSTDIWNDVDCYAKKWNNPCVCSHDRRPSLRLRGICPDSALDHLYIPRNHILGQLRYVSSMGSVISYTENKKVWILNKTGSDITGYSTSSKVSFSLGKHIWTIENDTYTCGQGKPYARQLKLTNCVDGEFTCSSGQCVKMEERCDQLVHCRDGSDERNCQMLVLSEGYNKKIPPITLINSSLVDVKVNVSITLLKIVDVNEVRHSIEIQFKIEIGWYERRANYNNLKQKSAMNVLAMNDVESLWLPLLTYANTDKKETTRLSVSNEWSTSVKVIREGGLTRGGIELVDEVEIFKGDQNQLVMRQVYTKTFQCQYDFALYPFDTQTCAIKMDTSEEDLDVVKLIPNKLVMDEDTDLTLFGIQSWNLEYTNATHEKDGVLMRLSLKRKVMNELLTTFLPTILLMTITFATTFFKPFFFEAALGVNLTTMLMMTTISIGKMQTLPTTAYIRMIDVWLVFCQLVPFVEVILLTAQECYRVEEQEGQDVGANKKKVGTGLTEVVPGAKLVQEKNIDIAIPSEGPEDSPKRKLQQLKNLGILHFQGANFDLPMFQRKKLCQ